MLMKMRMVKMTCQVRQDDVIMETTSDVLQYLSPPDDLSEEKSKRMEWWTWGETILGGGDLTDCQGRDVVARIGGYGDSVIPACLKNSLTRGLYEFDGLYNLCVCFCLNNKQINKRPRGFFFSSRPIDQTFLRESLEGRSKYTILLIYQFYLRISWERERNLSHQCCQSCLLYFLNMIIIWWLLGCNVLSVGPVVSTVVDVVTHSLRLLEISNWLLTSSSYFLYPLFSRYLFSLPSLMATRQLETLTIRERMRDTWHSPSLITGIFAKGERNFTRMAERGITQYLRWRGCQLLTLESLVVLTLDIVRCTLVSLVCCWSSLQV